MYTLENNVQVNKGAEIQAIADFLGSRWENVENPREMIEAIAHAALHAGRFWFNPYDVSAALRVRLDARRVLLAALEGDTSLLSLYDQPCRMLLDMAVAVSTVHEAGQTVDGDWDFSDQADAVVRKMQAAHPWLSKALPRGYAELAVNYRDFDGQEEYGESGRDARDAAEFAGANTAGACVVAFPHQVALPYVMYDDKCQGRRPAYVLVSAIYGHFLRIAEFMNTQEMLQALKELPWRDTNPQPVWELDLKSDHMLLQALLRTVQSNKEEGKSPKEQYEEAEADRRAFVLKTPQEQQAVREANQRNMMAMLEMLKKGGEDRHGHIQHEQEVQRCRELLRSGETSIKAQKKGFRAKKG